MVRGTHAVYANYEDAQKLIPVFEYYARSGSWRDLRMDARTIVRELEEVRNIDYDPLPGRQMFLTQEQYDFYHDVRDEIGK